MFLSKTRPGPGTGYSINDPRTTGRPTLSRVSNLYILYSTLRYELWKLERVDPPNHRKNPSLSNFLKSSGPPLFSTIQHPSFDAYYAATSSSNMSDTKTSDTGGSGGSSTDARFEFVRLAVVSLCGLGGDASAVVADL